MFWNCFNVGFPTTVIQATNSFNFPGFWVSGCQSSPKNVIVQWYIGLEIAVQRCNVGFQWVFLLDSVRVGRDVVVHPSEILELGTGLAQAMILFEGFCPGRKGLVQRDAIP